MDLVVLLGVALCIVLIPKTNQQYLDKANTAGLKGVLALGIVFHHLSGVISTGYNFMNFQYMGTYIVSVK